MSKKSEEIGNSISILMIYAYMKNPENRYSPDVFLTYLLGVLLLVGVDIPCTVAGSILALPAVILN